jgi:hypothetical protein
MFPTKKEKEYVYHVYLFYVIAVQIDKCYKQIERKKEEWYGPQLELRKMKGKGNVLQ